VRNEIDTKHRPVYHFLPPANWMNDPNGTIFWEEKYHLFYQYNPNGAFWGTIHWGHAVSEDLVHWKHLPVALAPDKDGPDRDGCFSGCAVDMEGKVGLFYPGIPDGLCLATNKDDELIEWEKHPSNPLLRTEGKIRIHDAKVWKEGEMWYYISGSHIGNIRDLGLSQDAAFMFRSSDMVHWEYMHPLYKPGQESDCACPEFFPLGDKYMLLFCSHTCGCQYYIGNYENQKFEIEQHERMNFTILRGGAMSFSGDLIAPITWFDDRNRRIMIGWIAEGRTIEAQKQAGWAGCLTLPRILSLSADGTLNIEPIPELKILRSNHRSVANISAGPDLGCVPIKDIQGDCMEIKAVIDSGDAEEVGLMLRRSPNGEEHTVVLYNRLRKVLSLFVVHSSQSSDVTFAGKVAQTGPFSLLDGELLELHIFIDKSVVEVFANNRQCLTKRIYPSRDDSTGIAFFGWDGKATLKSLDAWDLNHH